MLPDKAINIAIIKQELQKSFFLNVIIAKVLNINLEWQDHHTVLVCCEVKLDKVRTHSREAKMIEPLRICQSLRLSQWKVNIEEFFSITILYKHFIMLYSHSSVFSPS